MSRLVSLLPALALLAHAACVTAVPPVEAPTGESTAPPRSLTLASTQWPPFTADEGEPRVANALVADALASDRVTAEAHIIPVEGWLESVRAGEFDGSAAVWWSEERAEYLVFSAPYLENRLVLVARAGTDVSAASFDALAGQRVGIVEGYAYGEDLEAGAAAGVEFVAMVDTPANLRALLAEDLDYVLADALFARYSVLSHPQRDELVVGQTALVTRSLHFAVRKDLDEAETLIASFDARVRQMQRDGSYNRILGLRWIEVDVDGDGTPELVFDGEHAGEAPPTDSYRIHERREKQKPEVEFDYIIDGERYETWEQLPESYKTPGVGGTNVGVGIRW